MGLCFSYCPLAPKLSEEVANAYTRNMRSKQLGFLLLQCKTTFFCNLLEFSQTRMPLIFMYHST